MAAVLALGFFGMALVLILGGLVTSYVIRTSGVRPEISGYEAHKERFISTGDEEEKHLMLESMEDD